MEEESVWVFLLLQALTRSLLFDNWPRSQYHSQIRWWNSIGDGRPLIQSPRLLPPPLPIPEAWNAFILANHTRICPQTSTSWKSGKIVWVGNMSWLWIWPWSQSTFWSMHGYILFLSRYKVRYSSDMIPVMLFRDCGFVRSPRKWNDVLSRIFHFPKSAD